MQSTVIFTVDWLVIQSSTIRKPSSFHSSATLGVYSFRFPAGNPLFTRCLPVAYPSLTPVYPALPMLVYLSHPRRLRLGQPGSCPLPGEHPLPPPPPAANGTPPLPVSVNIPSGARAHGQRVIEEGEGGQKALVKEQTV